MWIMVNVVKQIGDEIDMYLDLNGQILCLAINRDNYGENLLRS